MRLRCTGCGRRCHHLHEVVGQVVRSGPGMDLVELHRTRKVAGADADGSEPNGVCRDGLDVRPIDRRFRPGIGLALGPSADSWTAPLTTRPTNTKHPATGNDQIKPTPQSPTSPAATSPRHRSRSDLLKNSSARRRWPSRGIAPRGAALSAVVRTGITIARRPRHERRRCHLPGLGQLLNASA